MELDTQASIEILKIISGYIFADLGTLLYYFAIGLLVGIVIAFLVYRLIKAKGWFKRAIEAKTRRLLFFVLRATFYLSIIGLSATIGLVIGSNRIVEKEVSTVVDESISYCKTNYFQDYEFISEVFDVANLVYSKGHDLDVINHMVAEVMTEEVSKKHGLGFLGKILLKGPENETVKFLEDLEKGVIMTVVTLGLEQIGAGEDIIDPDQIEKAFYAWLHSEEDSSLGNMNSFMSTQISNQVKPLIFSIWLPFVIITSLFILINIIEIIVYKYKARKRLKVALKVE